MQPLTTRLSIKVDEQFYISQNITYELSSLSTGDWERTAWISSHFKPLPVVTMTWRLIWNGLWDNDHSKAELVDIYMLATLMLAKPKLYILNKIQYTFWATTTSLFFFFLWTLDFSQNRTNISHHFSFKAGTILFSCLKQSKRKRYPQHYLIL